MHHLRVIVGINLTSLVNLNGQ